MFVDLDSPLNASSLLSASAELLVLFSTRPMNSSTYFSRVFTLHYIKVIYNGLSKNC